MLLEIEIDAEDAIKMLDGVASVLESDNFVDAAGAFVVNRIIERTMSGKDIHNLRFAPYSSAYAKKKGGTVNLFDSGRMLLSLDYNSSGSNQVTITCSSEIAQYHEDGTIKMPRRQFMGLTTIDMENMIEEIFTKPLGEILQIGQGEQQQPKQPLDPEDPKDYDLPFYETEADERKRRNRELDDVMDERKRYLEENPDEAERLRKRRPKPIWPTWIPQGLWDKLQDWLD